MTADAYNNPIHTRSHEQVRAVAKENAYAGLGVAMVVAVVSSLIAALTDAWWSLTWLLCMSLASGVVACGLLHAARFGGDDLQRWLAHERLKQELAATKTHHTEQYNALVKEYNQLTDEYNQLEDEAESLRRENKRLQSQVLASGVKYVAPADTSKTQLRRDCEKLLELWSRGSDYTRDVVTPQLMSRNRWDAAISHLAMLDMIEIVNRQRHISVGSMGDAINRLNDFDKQQAEVGSGVVLGG